MIASTRSINRRKNVWKLDKIRDIAGRSPNFRMYRKPLTFHTESLCLHIICIGYLNLVPLSRIDPTKCNIAIRIYHIRITMNPAAREPICTGTHKGTKTGNQDTWRLIVKQRLAVTRVVSKLSAWWRHQMETFSALLAICAGNSPVPGEFTTQRPVTQRFDVLCDLRLNKWLSKQGWGWWFETLSHPLWRHCNVKIHRHLSNAPTKAPLESKCDAIKLPTLHFQSSHWDFYHILKEALVVVIMI